MVLSVSSPVAAAAGLVVGAVGAGLAALVLRRATKYVPPKVWKHEAPSGGAWASTNAPTAGARTKKELQVGVHPIQLYSLGTPNGVKVTIMLEELAEADAKFDYDAWNISISGDQFSSGFVGVNPNSKIPAMVDTTTSPPTRVFESGAILIYLAEKYNRADLLPPSGPKRAEVLSWLMWQMGSAPFLGGGFGHFFAYAPEKFEYPINRYAMEAKRQLDVLDRNLASRKFVAGDDYSIADIAIWPWYGALVLGALYPNSAEFLDVASYTHVVRWAKLLQETRPAVRRGRMVNRSSADSTSPLYAELPALKERHSRADWAKE